MNTNDPSQLIPVAEAETCRALELGLVHGSADLPDDFTIEVSDFAVIRSGVSPREFERQWKEARAELIRRGYRVTEWRDEATMQGTARCQRLPNDAVSNIGALPGSRKTET